MSEYTPKTHEIRAAAVNHRAPVIHRQMFGQTIRDAERVALAEFDRWLAEVERAAAEKALSKAAEDWESGTVEHDEIKYTSDAPLGWSDESVVGAVISSGPVMDWLRARAKSYRRNEGGGNAESSR